MNTCDTCKHWGVKWERFKGVFGAPCDKLTDDANPPNTAVLVYSDSEPINTGPKFGCIFHEPK